MALRKDTSAIDGQANVENIVRIVGFQSDLVSFPHALDVFAFAATSDGFGKVLDEAMAATKPTVASKVASLTEIVNDGRTALLVEPENRTAFASTLTQMLSNPPVVMLERAQQRVNRYFPPIE